MVKIREHRDGDDRARPLYREAQVNIRKIQFHNIALPLNRPRHACRQKFKGAANYAATAGLVTRHAHFFDKWPRPHRVGPARMLQWTPPGHCRRPQHPT